MREERVTYSELRFHTSSQRRRRTPEVSATRGTKCFEPIDFSSSSPSWKLIAVVLWIICLLLLLSVGILATKLAEIHSGNLTSNHQTDRKEFISGISGIQQSSTNTQVWKCQPCEDNWHQHGKYCYLFSENTSPWRDCQLYCNSLLSSFLKIKTEEEMDFIKKISKVQCAVHHKKFWINVYYNSSQLKWIWPDGTVFTLDKFQFKRPDTASNQCKYITYGQLLDGGCEDGGFCICKKIAYGD